MGIITSSFPFIVGTVCGIYIAQNYDVPNIKRVFNDAISRAKQIEERYRKPRKVLSNIVWWILKYMKDLPPSHTYDFNEYSFPQNSKSL